MASDHYDVIVIGSGPGGGALAQKLAPTGKRILILERGDYLKREIDNWSVKAVFGENRYRASETWLDSAGKPFNPSLHYFVGGNSKVYGSALVRMRREDFGVLPHSTGVSPAWPLGYDTFDPYYLEAEALFHVHGRRGEDPNEPNASEPFPHPAVEHEPRIAQLSDALTRQGLRPFHLPLGILLDQKPDGSGLPTPGSACIRCAAFDGFPCLTNGKADAQIVCIDPMLACYPNVTLLTGANVTTLDTDPSGRTVTGVNVLREGVRERYSADIVVVACGALSSALLLLRSAGGAHPNGLANSSDQVGRNYMRHIQSVLIALSQRHGVPEDAGGQRLLLRHEGLAAPDGLGADVRQGARRAVARRGAARLAQRGAQSAAVQRAGEPRPRLLVVERGPAGPRQPGHAGTRRQGLARPHRQ